MFLHMSQNKTSRRNLKFRYVASHGEDVWLAAKALCCWKLRRFGLGANSWALSWINSSWHFDFERIWIRLDWMDICRHVHA